MRSTLAITVASLGLACAAPALAGAITVSPLPGTPDASPETQISILGTAPSNIESVTVTGTESGAHSGHLEDYSSAQGASFLLDSPLTEGEEVNVVIDLREGAPIDDSFTVAHLAGPPPLFNEPKQNPEDEQHFVSQPELLPVTIKVTKADPSLEGDFFMDPLPSPIIHIGKNKLEVEPISRQGPMILNPEGKLLWFNQLPNGYVASDTQKTTYEGKTVVAWWQGRVSEYGYGLGEAVIANTSYEPITYIKAGNGYKMDIHELEITPAGDAFIDIYSDECTPICDEAHDSSVDAVVEEIDIKTGLVMWEWHALGHVPTSQTEVSEPLNGDYDYYHVNSVQPLPGGDVLIGMRDTSAVYDVEIATGKILWQVGGKDSSFTMRKGSNFYFQHDPRLEGHQLTLFDNEAGPPIHGFSRGLVLKLNMEKKTAVVRHEYVRPEGGTGVPAEGSVQHMPDGDVVVGWGATPYFSEFTRNGNGKGGELLFNAELAKGDGTYRVIRTPWSATPHTLPAVAAVRESLNEVAVYASWNGATSVARWEVLEGPNAQSLAPAGGEAWQNFETKISVPTTEEGVFEVRALNSEGRVLATSEPVTAG